MAPKALMKKIDSKVALCQLVGWLCPQLRYGWIRQPVGWSSPVVIANWGLRQVMWEARPRRRMGGVGSWLEVSKLQEELND